MASRQLNSIAPKRTRLLNAASPTEGEDGAAQEQQEVESLHIAVDSEGTSFDDEGSSESSVSLLNIYNNQKKLLAQNEAMAKRMDRMEFVMLDSLNRMTKILETTVLPQSSPVMDGFFHASEQSTVQNEGVVMNGHRSHRPSTFSQLFGSSQPATSTIEPMVQPSVTVVPVTDAPPLRGSGALFNTARDIDSTSDSTLQLQSPKQEPQSSPNEREDSPELMMSNADNVSERDAATPLSLNGWVPVPANQSSTAINNKQLALFAAAAQVVASQQPSTNILANVSNPINRQRSSVQQKIIDCLQASGLDFTTYSNTRKWINCKLRDLVTGGDIEVAYSYLGDDETSVSRTKYADGGEIICEPLKVLDQLKEIGLRDPVHGGGFSKIIEYPMLLKDILVKAINNSRQKLYARHGCLARTKEEMALKAAQRNKRKNPASMSSLFYQQ